MTALQPINVLLITDSTEQTTRLTHDLRQRYEGCRVEAIRTLNEGLEWAGKLAWDLILLDADHAAFPGLSFIRSLRARIPGAGIVLHTDRTLLSPLQAMQTGADAVLFRQSPDFTDELLSAVQEVLLRKERPAPPEPAHSHYLHIVESAGLILYELNSRGEFTYVSPTVHLLLGYGNKELLGRHYSQVLDAESRRYAEQRFNERRAGARATHCLELHLMPKFRKGVLRARLHAAVSAKGLYASSNVFLGTLGIIHRLERQRSGRPTPIPSAATEPAGQRAQSAPSLEAIETLWQKIQHFLGKATEVPSVVEDERPPVPSSVPRRAESLKSEPPTIPPAPGSGSERASTVPAVEESDASLTTLLQEEPPLHQLHTDLRSESGTVSGITTALDVAGLQFRLTTPSANVPTGQAAIRLASDVMFLHLSGTVMPDAARFSMGRVLFDPVEEIQRAVLLSFLEALREEPGCLKVDIVILGSAESTPPFAPPAPDIAWQIESGDRRLDFRISCAIRTFLRPREERYRNEPIPIGLSNISLGGCCFSSPTQLSTQLSKGWDPLQLVLPQPDTTSSPPTDARGSDHPATVPVMIVWEKPSAPVGPSPDRETRWTYGARFTHIPDRASDHFYRLVNLQALSAMDDAEQRSARRVVTDLVSCINPYDRRIALYHDYDPRGQFSLSPLVIIAPGFAHPKEHYAELAYYLACQGMHVLRYDYTNHVGESDAVSSHTTLNDMFLDFVTLLDLAAEFWPSCPLFVIGHGLGGRVAARGLKDHSQLAGLLLLHVPLDLYDELHRLQHTDIDPMQTHKPDIETGTIFGLNVMPDPFVRDAIVSRFVGAQDFLDDLGQLRAPVGMFAPLEDAATHRDIIERIRTTLGATCRFVTFLAEPIMGALTQPLRQENWFDRIARFCLAESTRTPPADALMPMSVPDLSHEKGLELTRLRCLHHRPSAARARNWNDYAIHSRTLLNLPDYWKLLERSCQLLGPLDSTHRLLCVGDGSGHVGTFLFTHHAYRQRTLGPDGPDIPAYAGLDFHRDGLIQSRQILLSIQARLSREASRPWLTGRSIQPSFFLGDLDGPLPLADNSYDAVFCHIVLGHFADPLSALRECVRILVPGGRLVVLGLQPAADLSTWYRHQLSRQASGTGPSSGGLLRAFGEFQRNYLEGSLRRFTDRQMELLLGASGGRQPMVESALSDQVHIATARKPNSTG